MSSSDDQRWQRVLPPTRGDDEGDRLSQDNRDYLADRGTTLDRVVTVERVRHRNPEVELAVLDAMQNDAKAPLLRFLVTKGEAAAETYDTLTAVVTASRRTVRHHVADLVEAGVLSKSDGRPVRVGWDTSAAYLLATDAAARLDRVNAE